MKEWQILLIHQILFQGMFLAKNILLKRKIKTAIQGSNPEARVSALFFIGFILLSFYLSFFQMPHRTADQAWAIFLKTAAIVIMILSLIISGFSLVHLKDSWRVGVLENQKTSLVTSGIYALTRNPYFVSYLLMFFAYTVLLNSLLLLGLSAIGFCCIHMMIRKEEAFLTTVHGDIYARYKQSAPRYLIF